MLLGVFGLPGGAELLIIIGVALAVFAPSLLLFWLGWVLGRRSGAVGGASAAAATDGPAQDSVSDSPDSPQSISDAEAGDPDE